jgi:hypothetical protein
MKRTILKSYRWLVRVDVTLFAGGLKRIYDAVREQPTAHLDVERRIPYEQLCKAMDLACVFYPKTVLCLQRSMATVLLLRSYGWPAQFVTGCAFATLENHAWVEINGCVVNDKPYLHDMYQVIDRC